MDTEKLAQEFQAEYCDECETWIFVDAPPFGEGDRTKPIRGQLHMAKYHPERITRHEGRHGCVIEDYPWMTANTDSVVAVLEDHDDR